MQSLLAALVLLATTTPVANQEDPKTKNDLVEAARLLPTALAEAKRAGVPLNAADLAPSPPIKPADNAIPLIRRAMVLYDRLHNRDLDGIVLRLVAKNDYSDAEHDLKKAASALDAAMLAAGKHKADFGRDWDNGLTLRNPEAGDMKHFVRLLCVRAEILAHQGDHAKALKSLLAAKQLTLDFEADPTMLSVLLRSEGLRAVMGSSLRCLAMAKSPKEVQLYVAFFSRRLPPIDLFRMLKTEAYCGVATIRNLDVYGGVEGIWNVESSENPVQVNLKRLRRYGMPPGTVARANMARHLEMWAHILDEARPIQFNPRLVLTRANANLLAPRSQPGQSYAVDTVLGPGGYGDLGDVIVGDDARWVVERALSKVLLYKSRHGSFPKTLAGAGVTDLDPCDGKPLKYLVGSSSVMVYSVGADGVDNHGLSRYGGLNTPKQWDEIAQFPPPVRHLSPK